MSTPESSPRRGPRRATAPATRDGVPTQIEVIEGQTLDDLDRDVNADRDADDRVEWLRRQRPPHWG